jgi:hypothetical protein
MSEAATPLFELEAPVFPSVATDEDLRERAQEFCETRPFRQGAYAKRNWGGLLHSLCSYQGKLKPSIAHFLISWFTEPGHVILDPMAGVGTIPLEARLQARGAVAGDISELAYVVSKAKLEAFDGDDVIAVVESLIEYTSDQAGSLEALVKDEQADFGLNGAVRDYFEEQTLREVLLARRYFRSRLGKLSSPEAVVLSSILHILHGNRPYALSRRSHPVTPFSPTGPFEYRPLAGRLIRRVQQVVTALLAVGNSGHAHLSDYNQLPLRPESVDAVITSPPFSESLRFFSSNWMRLWFCGWDKTDFMTNPEAYLERRQRDDFDRSYREFALAMAVHVRPGGLLIMHLGETEKFNMATRIAPLVAPEFRVVFSGRECVADTESHGLRDKGATRAHHFLFCRRQ